MIAATDALRETIDAALHEAFGSGASMEAYAPLSRRAATVARVTVAGAANAPRTVVVKHVAAIGAPITDAPEFAEEVVAHRFLHSLGLEEGLKARLLGSSAAGVILLEDLGPHPFTRRRSYGELVPRLARALARLHGGTRGALREYEILRGQASLGEDRRRYGLPAERRRFESGRRYVAELVAARASAHLAAFEREVERAARLIEHPGAFAALIHDDLGNARQTFEVGDDLYLLDFEYARIDHALLDFMKALIGKIEVRIDHNVSVWTNPAFPRHLLDVYRGQMPDRWSDDEWRENADAAMIHAALTLTGRIAGIAPTRPLAGTRAQNINGVLYRLLQLLGPASPFRATYDAIRDALGVGSPSAGRARL